MLMCSQSSRCLHSCWTHSHAMVGQCLRPTAKAKEQAAGEGHLLFFMLGQVCLLVPLFIDSDTCACTLMGCATNMRADCLLCSPHALFTCWNLVYALLHA
jgi:hypothetical protein